MKTLRLLPLLIATLVLLGACAGAPDGDAAVTSDTASATLAAGRVDSAFPMPVMLERFRADIPEPAVLASGAGSRDALVRQLVVALQAADTAAFRRISVTRAEWAWLYFPTSLQASPPYELPPALAWFRLEEGNRQALLRALDRFAGKALDYQGYACDPDPTVEGESRIWIGCLVTLGVDGRSAVALRLFSAILERDGRFAILSWVNDF